MVVHHYRFLFLPGVTQAVSSDQAARGTAGTCLPLLPSDLTGFHKLTPHGPDLQHHLLGSDPRSRSRRGIDLLCSGLQVQNTATSRLATKYDKKKIAEREGFEPSRRGFCPVSRFPGERLNQLSHLRTTLSLHLTPRTTSPGNILFLLLLA